MSEYVFFQNAGGFLKMETAELMDIVKRDEDSCNQLKSNVTNELSLAREMIAFTNTLGGRIFIGVSECSVLFK